MIIMVTISFLNKTLLSRFGLLNLMLSLTQKSSEQLMHHFEVGGHICYFVSRSVKHLLLLSFKWHVTRVWGRKRK